MDVIKSIKHGSPTFSKWTILDAPNLLRFSNKLVSVYAPKKSENPHESPSSVSSACDATSKGIWNFDPDSYDLNYRTPKGCSAKNSIASVMIDDFLLFTDDVY